jgi:hypothetical protein
VKRIEENVLGRAVRRRNRASGIDLNGQERRVEKRRDEVGGQLENRGGLDPGEKRREEI